MRCLFKGLFRTTVIGAALLAAVAGGATMVVGSDRVEAAIEQAADHARAVIDRHVDDTVALRHQLATLSERYPARIAEVRSDLRDLRGDITRLERERAVSDRVVQLVDLDLATLQPAVRDALALNTEGNKGRARLAAVRFEDEVMSVGRAQSKLQQIQNTRAAHVARAADAQHNLQYLRQQEDHFVALLGDLEAEHTQLRTQLAQLEREVDSIARNERLIELLSKRQRTLEEASRYDAVSLGDLTGRLSRIRTEQEARLDMLAANRQAKSYEDIAAHELDAPAGASRYGEVDCSGEFASDGEACVLAPIER